MSESERQIKDVVVVLEKRRHALDRAYIEKWVAELGLDSQWNERVAGRSQPRIKIPSQAILIGSFICPGGRIWLHPQSAMPERTSRNF